MRREKFLDNTSDTLSASASDTDTTLTVTDGSKWPTEGDFRVLIGSEIVLVTARSTNALTVVRGQEGTTAASHGSGSAIAMVVTAGNLQQYGRDNAPGFDGSRPPFRLVDATGAVLDSSDFTTVNLSTSTISDSDSEIVLRKHGNALVGQDFTMLARSYSEPATVIAAIRFCHVGTSSSFPSADFGIRDSASGKATLVTLTNVSAFWGIQLVHLASPTSIDSFLSGTSTPWGGSFAGDVVWLKGEDDGTNHKLSISADGVNWILLYSESRTAYMSAPDQFVWGANNFENGLDTLTILEAWSEG